MAVPPSSTGRASTPSDWSTLAAIAARPTADHTPGRVRAGARSVAAPPGIAAPGRDVKPLGDTTTAAGLRVRSEVDPNRYAKGVVVTDAQMAEVHLTPHAFHGNWNYTIRPTGRKK